ncbi:nucleoside monophosphate kinase [Legionella gresilensis]|uniref:nucleoside monophosphate kinase n=1 Tax=Legionella gresilensis TaxID=91823 RepID=UPI001040EF18|nr:nucleoside monophosphate kinase [Legionella gresilensis]
MINSVLFFNKFLGSSSTSTLPKIILLMGGPGSGKGVLAKQLPNTNHFSIGESLRTIINNPKHPKAQLFKQRIEQGKLLNDQEVIEVMNQADAFKQTKPVLLDGFPRTLMQWHLFKNYYGSPAAVIDLAVSKDIMRSRLLSRGRKDDKVDVINYRIEDYFNNTRPMANKILSETTNALRINASTLNPKEIAEITKKFLESKHIYPLDNQSKELTSVQP